MGRELTAVEPGIHVPAACLIWARAHGELVAGCLRDLWVILVLCLPRKVFWDFKNLYNISHTNIAKNVYILCQKEKITKKGNKN